MSGGAAPVAAVAVVLAGGRSTRFGSEKAVALREGRPMIASVAAALASCDSAVAVNAPPGSGAAAWARGEGLALLPDPPGLPDGPLAGVAAGLAWAQALGAEALLTAPCDTPRLPPALGPRLLAALADAPAAYAETASGSHPLCAAWRPALEPRLAAVLATGHPSVRALLAEWGAAAVRFAEAADFANVNTPEAL